MKRLKTASFFLLLFLAAALFGAAGCQIAASAPQISTPPPTISNDFKTKDEQIISKPSATPTPLPAKLSTDSFIKTPTPTGTATLNSLQEVRPTRTPPPGLIAYTTRPGDTLQAVASRFEVRPSEIQCENPSGVGCPFINQVANPDALQSAHLKNIFLSAGTTIWIPQYQDSTGPKTLLLPDSAVVFSETAANFDVYGFLESQAGYVNDYEQYLMISGWTTGAKIIERVAVENSINPRLLIALLSFQCDCVSGFPDETGPMMDAPQARRQDMYGQLVWAVDQLSDGYYGWRTGSLTKLSLPSGEIVQLDPSINAGTAAVQYFFGQLYDESGWRRIVGDEGDFIQHYSGLFEDPWAREIDLIPKDVALPVLALPFEPGKIWSFSGGPHPAWEGYGPSASLDFAPKSNSQGCLPSSEWVTAMADGIVVRSNEGVVVQDLDGDGIEQTGWNLIYLHLGLDTHERIPIGTRLTTGERIGNPSCEGGRATGTHVHIARKYNGEWIPADGPLPFLIDGWMANNGDEPYKGSLIRGEEIITACTCGAAFTWIMREEK